MAFCTAENLLAIERRGLLASQDLSKMNILDRNTRRKILRFTYILSHSFKLKLRTTILALDIINIFYEREAADTYFNNTNMYLVYSASVILACKMMELYLPELDDFICHAPEDVKIDKPMLEKFELIVYNVLSGDFNIPNYLHFIELIHEKISVSSEVRNFCKYLGLLIATNIPGVYLPSVIATSIHYISSDLFKYSKVNIFEIPEHVIHHCINSVAKLIAELRRIHSDDISKTPWYEDSIFDPVVALNYSDTYLSSEYTCEHYREKYTPIPQIKSEYIKIKTLGSGTYSKVRQIQTPNGTFALKISKNNWNDYDGILTSFIREVSILSVTSHPNIISMKGMNILDNKYHIHLELLTYDMKVYMEAHKNRSHSDKFSITKQICSGLEYLHNMGIVHRDIKPQNILISFVDNDIVVKITDFGICRGSCITNLIHCTTYVCTLWYRPAEIILEGNYDQRIDVWSIGCCLYELAIGTEIFTGDSDIDQLFKIFRLLGTPTNSTWPGVEDYRCYKSTFPQWIKKETIWPKDCSIHMGIKLVIERCLVLNIASTPNIPSRAFTNELLPILCDSSNDKIYTSDVSAVPNSTSTQASTISINPSPPTSSSKSSNTPSLIHCNPQHKELVKVDQTRRTVLVIKEYLSLIEVSKKSEKILYSVELFDYLAEKCIEFIENNEQFKDVVFNKYREIKENINDSVKEETRQYFNI